VGQVAHPTACLDALVEPVCRGDRPGLLLTIGGIYIYRLASLVASSMDLEGASYSNQMMASMAAGESGSSMRRRAWVVEVEKTLDEADASVEVSRWQLHSIYRVPACIKDLNRKAYKPQVVSLGPFHHRRDGELLPMEEHKKRALRHLLRRSKRPLEEFAAAVADVAGQLESAYLDLGAEWRGADGRERFLEMMIVDGCFLLEVIKATEMDGRNVVSDYAPNDPIFSHHGVLYMVPYIRRDMLMLENQLPLLLLEKLVAVQTGKPPVLHTIIIHSVHFRRKYLIWTMMPRRAPTRSTGWCSSSCRGPHRRGCRRAARSGSTRSTCGAGACSSARSRRPSRCHGTWRRRRRTSSGRRWSCTRPGSGSGRPARTASTTCGSAAAC
jgi:hypothetical protein